MRRLLLIVIRYRNVWSVVEM